MHLQMTKLYLYLVNLTFAIHSSQLLVTTMSSVILSSTVCSLFLLSFTAFSKRIPISVLYEVYSHLFLMLRLCTPIVIPDMSSCFLKLNSPYRLNRSGAKRHSCLTLLFIRSHYSCSQFACVFFVAHKTFMIT